MHPIILRERRRIQRRQAWQSVRAHYGSITLGVVIAIAYWSLFLAAHNVA